MRLTDHINSIFTNNLYMATACLDNEKAFDAPWCLGLIHILLTLQFSISLINLIGSLLSQRKFRVSAEGEMSVPRDIQAGVPQVSVLPPTLYSLRINDMTCTPAVYLGLFAHNAYIHATDHKEDYVLRKPQQGLSAIET
jgi:hypothetical protein